MRVHPVIPTTHPAIQDEDVRSVDRPDTLRASRADEVNATTTQSWLVFSFAASTFAWPLQRFPMSKASGESYDYSTSLLNSANLTVRLHRHRAIIAVVLVFFLTVILSPLWIFWLDPADGLNWADTVEHVFTAVGILGAGCALVGWLLARADRRTDLLVSLHAQFGTAEIIKGKSIIDNEPAAITATERDDIDRLLSFYVLICGVRASGEVPEKSLSICFRYWLGHYYRTLVEKDPVTQQTKPKPNGFRDYVNCHYPTLRTWLLDDIKKPERNKSFFRPHEFWKTEIETDPKKLWPSGS